MCTCDSNIRGKSLVWRCDFDVRSDVGKNGPECLHGRFDLEKKNLCTCDPRVCAQMISIPFCHVKLFLLL